MTSIEKELEKSVNDVSKLGRAVVAKRVGIVGAVTVLINLALAYGWITPDISNNVLHYLNSALDAVGVIVAIAVTHPAVTPVSSPRNDVGTPLIPVTQAQALADDAVAQAVEHNVGAETPAGGGEAATAVDDSADEVVEEAPIALTDNGSGIVPPAQA